MKPVSQTKTISSMLFNGFFVLVKICVAGALILSGVMIASQNSVAPVSTRLLSTYALEYATKTIKPYRHLFPKPYMVYLEE